MKELEEILKDDTEASKIKEYNSCNGCNHKPIIENTDKYPHECGSCKRFYGDSWNNQKDGE